MTGDFTPIIAAIIIAAASLFIALGGLMGMLYKSLRSDIRDVRDDVRDVRARVDRLVEASPSQATPSPLWLASPDIHAKPTLWWETFVRIAAQTEEELSQQS